MAAGAARLDRDRLRGLVMAAVALREVFLSPPAERVAERAVPASLAVLASAADGPTAGAAVALTCRAPVAVVALWGASARGGFALPPARRLAERLSARGLVATARGRLVTVALPADPAAARAAAERAQAATGEAPFVLVVAGPRPPAFDPLLAAADRLVVVPSPGAADGLEPLALAAAARLGRAVSVLRLGSTTPTTRMLVASGFAVPPGLRITDA